MWIRDFWNRVLAKFRKEDSVSEPVMELTAQEAPEPVPERKTSDEMIIEMAQSAAEPPQTDASSKNPEPEAESEVEPEAEPEVEPEAETGPEDEAYEDEREYFEEEC
jgi:hypothetical protein